ncbi:MAG TPA: alpha-amylase family glycosyl hydrolase [Polyangia bacterium]|jgi:alpha-glucosidase
MMQPTWWQRGVIYQIYPRSFQDANGDGIGDLSGVVQRLDYLGWLGVDALWLSPFYPSPMADFGYDVADYCDVDPRFGTLADFDALVGAAHARGLRVLVDFVPNHTSNEHPWFRESRASCASPRRDWYLWRDPAPGGGPPNNWLAHFGGPAWTLDATTGQYYYHAFLPEQPDLNWRNPAVVAAMLDVMRFWLGRGADGFRVDVIWHLLKDADCRDNPPNPDWHPGQGPSRRVLPLYVADQPGVHDLVAAMRAVCEEYPGDRLLIGEIYLPLARLIAYYGEHNSGAHLPFNFQLLRLPWRAPVIREAVNTYEAMLPPGAWPNWVLGNHDHHRIATRVGPAQARVAAMLLLTLRGTPTLYQGDELGMVDVPIPPAAVQDPYERNVPGHGFGRDPERTPMQWDQGPGAGFTTGTPWLPLAQDADRVNVVTLREDPRSLLTLHRRLLALRRAEPALSVGDYTPRDSHGDVFAFARAAAGRRLTVTLNLGHEPHEAVLPAGRVLLSTHLDREGDAVGGVVQLRPDEGIIALG